MLYLSIMILGLSSKAVSAQSATSNLPMNRVYQGKIVFPDFKGRDKEFSNYRTRITEEMKTGPNFAGHYAIVIIGCGTACKFAFVADIANGKVYDFPYGGEQYYQMSINFDVKSPYVYVRWISEDSCLQSSLIWDGSKFKSDRTINLGKRDLCDL